MTDWWRKPRKWNIPLTYEPKIAGVRWGVSAAAGGGGAMTPLTHFSLFSGIGGLDLAAEWAGFRTVGQVEYANYPFRVLRQRFGRMPRWRDIRDVTGEAIIERCGVPTVISGGFPCQPHSLAGKRLASCDERDLWGELARVVREVKPRWFVGENVAGLRSCESGRFFGRVLRDLAEMGYTVGWGSWEAADAGAPHHRERVFIVAHSDDATTARQRRDSGEVLPLTESEGPDLCGSYVAHSPNLRYSSRADRGSQRERVALSSEQGQDTDIWSEPRRRCADVPNPYGDRREERDLAPGGGEAEFPPWNADPVGGLWLSEPSVGRVADGIPSRLDRLKCLGNAVVPQQAFPIFQAIAAIEIGAVV